MCRSKQIKSQTLQYTYVTAEACYLSYKTCLNLDIRSMGREFHSSFGTFTFHFIARHLYGLLQPI